MVRTGCCHQHFSFSLWNYSYRHLNGKGVFSASEPKHSSYKMGQKSSQAVVFQMGWTLWLHNSKKPLSQSEVWIKCCTISTGNMNTFPLIISSCKSFRIGLKGNNWCIQNKFSFFAGLFKENAKLLSFSKCCYLDKISSSEKFKCFTRRLVSFSAPVKRDYETEEEKKNKGSFTIVPKSPSESYYTNY